MLMALVRPAAQRQPGERPEAGPLTLLMQAQIARPLPGAQAQMFLHARRENPAALSRPLDNIQHTDQPAGAVRVREGKAGVRGRREFTRIRARFPDHPVQASQI